MKVDSHDLILKFEFVTEIFLKGETCGRVKYNRNTNILATNILVYRW